MNSKRLTTDNPKGNFEKLMNYAYAKNNRTHLSYAGGKYDVDLCEYVSNLAKAKGYDFSPEFIMEDGLFENYDDDFAILYYCAVQAAELRARMKMYEDKLESGTLIDLPKKFGEYVYFIKSAFSIADEPIKATIVGISIMSDGAIYYNSVTENNGICRHFYSSAIGKAVFLTKEEAEKALKESKI